MEFSHLGAIPAPSIFDAFMQCSFVENFSFRVQRGYQLLMKSLLKLNYGFVGRLGVDTRTKIYLCLCTLYRVWCIYSELCYQIGGL